MQVMPSAAITNPNASWLNTRGMWLGYLTSVAILHFILLSVPFFSTALAWTLTHVIHNVVSNVRHVFIYIVPSCGGHYLKYAIECAHTLLYRVCTSCSTI